VFFCILNVPEIVSTIGFLFFRTLWSFSIRTLSRGFVLCWWAGPSYADLASHNLSCSE